MIYYCSLTVTLNKQNSLIIFGILLSHTSVVGHECVYGIHRVQSAQAIQMCCWLSIHIQALLWYSLLLLFWDF